MSLLPPYLFECSVCVSSNRKYKIALMTYLRFACGGNSTGELKPVVNGRWDIVSVGGGGGAGGTIIKAKPGGGGCHAMNAKVCEKLRLTA